MYPLESSNSIFKTNCEGVRLLLLALIYILFQKLWRQWGICGSLILDASLVEFHFFVQGGNLVISIENCFQFYCFYMLNSFTFGTVCIFFHLRLFNSFGGRITRIKGTFSNTSSKLINYFFLQWIFLLVFSGIKY